MRTLRLSLVGTVILALLGGLGGAVVAQSDEDQGMTEELIFEVTLPPGVMADRIERINTGGLTFAPGFEAVIGTDNEAIRGLLMYVESGELVITPMVDSPIWPGGAALGGSPVTAPGGEAVPLAPGDLIFLPVIAVEDLVPGATTTIANPGAEPAVTQGFHAHAYESFPGFPEGISDSEGFAEANDADAMATIVAGDVTFRSTRLIAPVGLSLPLDDSALFTLVDVYDGMVKRTATGPEGTTAPFWNPIHGGYLPGGPDWTFDLTVSGDEPATVSQMTVVPVAGTAAQESATVTYPVFVTGTEACGPRSGGTRAMKAASHEIVGWSPSVRTR